MRARQDPQTPPTQPDRARLRARTRDLRRRLAALDYLASGTITTRTKVCGKPNCRCATDPDARHGPYYEWGRMIGKKLVHTNIPAERVELMRRAIDNHRQAKELLHEWERLTAQEILHPEPDEP